MSDPATSAPRRTLQLRRYQLTPQTLDEFVRWWRDDLLPVRNSYGFEVPFACVVPETAELIWVVSYAGDEEAFTDAERRYNEWPDRLASMGRQPSRPVGAETHFIQNVFL